MVKGVQSQKATLIGLHDEIAGLKAEYDADKKLSPESLYMFSLMFHAPLFFFIYDSDAYSIYIWVSYLPILSFSQV